MDWTKQADSMADHYQGFLAPAMFEPCAEILLDAAELAPGMDVLDVACGTGVVSRAAARRVGAGGTVLGIDMAPPMLHLARAQPPEDGAAAIDYREGDAQTLPVGYDAFDVVVCQHGVQFFPDRAAAVREMARAVRPGGTIAIACWARLEDSPYIMAIVESLRDHLGEEAAAGMRMPFSVGPDDLAELLDGLEAVSVKVAQVPAAYRAAPREAAARMILAGPLAPAFTSLDETRREAFTEDLGAKMAAHDSGDGYLRPPMFSSIATARRAVAMTPDARREAAAAG